MAPDFCTWAPWVFSILAGLTGWFLRAWYDETKISSLKILLKNKEEDLYHLHEAHELLLKDKKEKLSEYSDQSELKSKSIDELKQQLTQAEETNQSLLAQLVEKKKDESPSPITYLSSSKEINESFPSDDMEITEDLIPFEPEESDNVIPMSAPLLQQEDKNKKKKKSGQYKEKYKSQLPVIKDLKKENKRLQQELDHALKTQEVVREIPITITKEIKIRERVNHKKLRRLMDAIPLKKKKKTISKKKKIGKPRIVEV